MSLDPAVAAVRLAVRRELVDVGDQPVEGPGSLAALAELAADRGDAGDHARPDAVHHHVGVALEQRHHPGDPVDDLLLLGRAHHVHEAAAVAADGPADTLQAVLEHPGRLDAVGQVADLGAQVVAHPRDRGELHAVRLLVEADPQPEVGRVDAELTLDVDDVGGHQEQATGVGRAGGVPVVAEAVEGVELPEDLGAQEAEHQAHLGPGDAGPDGQRQAVRGALLLRQAGDERVEDAGEAVGVGLHPAPPVDHEHGRGVLLRHQAGEVAHQRGGATGVVAQLGHRGGRGLRRHLGAVTGHLGAEVHGEVPVDH